MEEPHSSDDDTDEILNLLKDTGVNTIRSSKRQRQNSDYKLTKKITVLEDIVIKKPDNDLTDIIKDASAPAGITTSAVSSNLEVFVKDAIGIQEMPQSVQFLNDLLYQDVAEEVVLAEDGDQDLQHADGSETGSSQLLGQDFHFTSTDGSGNILAPTLGQVFKLVDGSGNILAPTPGQVFQLVDSSDIIMSPTIDQECHPVNDSGTVLLPTPIQKQISDDAETIVSPRPEQDIELAADTAIIVTPSPVQDLQLAADTQIIATPSPVQDLQLAADTAIIATPSPIQDLQIPEITEGENMQPQVKRRNRHARPDTWKKNVTKQQRMKGKQYSGYERNRAKKVKSGVMREERCMGPSCNSRFCEKSSKRFCSEFNEDARKEIFKNFWNEVEWEGKKAIICALVDKKDVKQRTRNDVEEGSRRSETFYYHLKLQEERKPVCKKMFLNTLGLKEGMVLNWLRKYVKSGITLQTTQKQESKRGKLKLLSIPNENGIASKDHVLNFFTGLPKLPSHYCRSTSSKLYLEPIYKSKNHLYEVYKQKCNEDSVLPVSNCTFFNTFAEQNLSLHTPKKDRCDVCCAYEAKNITLQDYNKHITKKNAAREEKAKDKDLAKEGKLTVLTVDLQSVKVCPKLEASAIYYKTKLCCHNYTIYNISNRNVMCYWWHECEGELMASNFASCLVNYIHGKVPKIIPLVIYSDGCTNQNRNSTLANALLQCAIQYEMSITQKYLEKGHTHMECDSVHSVIENKLKNTDIYLPHEYVKITREAKTKNPKYEAKYVTHDFFRDYSTIQRYSSIRPGRKSGDFVVTNIRELNYDPSGIIRYKLNFQDELNDLPVRPKKQQNTDIKAMYTSQISLKQRKWKDLQELKLVIPRDCHSFYDNLPKCN